MSTTTESTITREQLLKHGWEEVKNGGPVYFKKDLTDKSSEDYDPEDGGLSMVLHRFTPGYTLFGIMLPSGGILNINPSSIKELNQVERLIIGYDSPF